MMDLHKSLICALRNVSAMWLEGVYVYVLRS